MNALRPVPDRAVGELFEGDIPNPAQAGQSRAKAVNAEFKAQAHQWMQDAGASIVRGRHKVGAYEVEAEVIGPNGRRFLVLVHGVPDDGERAGLRRTDTVKKAGFDAIVIGRLQKLPVLIMTSHLPESGAAQAMLADCADDIFDVFATNDDFAGFQRLRHYLHDDPPVGPLLRHGESTQASEYLNCSIRWTRWNRQTSSVLSPMTAPTYKIRHERGVRGLRRR